MADMIAIVVLVVCVGGASYYIWKSKKNGAKCIGCPASGSGSCHCKDSTKK